MAVVSAKSDAGFTLVEILCVLALLGLTAGLVVLNLPKPAPPFRTEVASVTTLLNLAARESIIDGQTRGVDFSTSGLEILKYDGEWISEGQQDLTYVYRLNLTVEQQSIDIEDRTKKKEKTQKEKTEAEFQPLIYFDATGNVTPFTLSLRGEEEAYTLEPDPRGRIVMEPSR